MKVAHNRIWTPVLQRRSLSPSWDTSKREYRFDTYGNSYEVAKWPHDRWYTNVNGEWVLKKRCIKCLKDLYPFEAYERHGITYCDQDYHLTFSPKCAECDEPIRETSNMKKILGKTYHAEHVKCSECKFRLWDDIKLKDGKMYCDYDYTRLFSLQCATCVKPIRGGSVSAMGKTFHKGSCFRCNYCYKVLDESTYLSLDDKPYCKFDWYRLFATKCGGCYKPVIHGAATYAAGKYFHKDCMSCYDCGQRLDDESVREYRQRTYCRNHYLIHLRLSNRALVSPTRSLSATFSRSSSPLSDTGFRPRSSLS